MFKGPYWIIPVSLGMVNNPMAYRGAGPNQNNSFGTDDLELQALK
jgi:hypothetical protein